MYVRILEGIQAETEGDFVTSGIFSGMNDVARNQFKTGMMNVEELRSLSRDFHELRLF